MQHLPWGKYSMFSRGQSSTDFAWLANEISAIRSGVDNLTRDSATHKERITTVIQDLSKLEMRVSSNESKIETKLKTTDEILLGMKLATVKSDSAWAGPIKVAAALPVIAVLLAISQYLVNLGIIQLFH